MAQAAPLSLNSGSWAAELLGNQCQRLVRLQGDVLADRDPEPLHQLRVSLRRLRTLLVQFEAALELPETVAAARIAGVARRTSLTRDLDVLAQRIEGSLLPALPECEQTPLSAALKRLRRERRDAFEQLRQALRGGRHLKLLAHLQHWLRQPRFTPLGLLPLSDWLVEWQQPSSATLLLHPGWFSEDPDDACLHDLRKRIKGVRYSLENLQPHLDPALGDWITALRQAQDHLGELNDLQVLRRALSERALPVRLSRLPQLREALDRQQSDCWQQWRSQVNGLLDGEQRRQLHRRLAGMLILP